MIIKKEFYFVRHGQTDGNIPGIRHDYGDIPLNNRGRAQARSIESVIASLPIKTVCYSPLKRSKETREIACSNLSAEYSEVEGLSECNTEIWLEMTAIGENAHKSSKEPVYGFMRAVVNGLNLALSREGPVLIVAHGGVHWAICCLMGIEQHDWSLDHCIVTHFSIRGDGHWVAKKLHGSIL